MPQNLALQVAIIGAISALIGALVGALSTVLVTWIGKRFDERKHYRELLINAAIENYKEERMMARAILEKNQNYLK